MHTTTPYQHRPPACFEPLEARLFLSADVLMRHNDLANTGQNLQETTLTPANVSGGTFGKLFTCAVDAQVYAQPLLKTNVAIPGTGTHDVLYVATENNSVYAFDADSGALLWQRNFNDPANGITPIPASETGQTDLTPLIGITSTPVIDPATNRIYLVNSIKVTSGAVSRYAQIIRALDLSTGNDAVKPVRIRASLPGTGDGSINGKITYSALQQNQRPALSLVNGIVYVASASFGDTRPYHGWVLGYRAGDLHRVLAWANTPNGLQGGIWMSGSAISADAKGALYLTSGNGTFRPSQNNWANGVVKLVPRRGTLQVVDYFEPYNYAFLSAQDYDVGSGGVLLIPGKSLALTGNKLGSMYVMNQNNLGGFTRGSNRIVQTVPSTGGGLYSTPAYFNGRVYAAQSQDTLRAYAIAGGKLKRSSVGAAQYAFPGSTPSISANGNSNGIVWIIERDAGGNAILHAFDAANVATELYSSATNAADAAGAAVKFNPPTVANGMVYVATDGAVVVYGLGAGGGGPGPALHPSNHVDPVTSLTWTSR